MTTSHMSTAIDATHTVLSQDGAKISYLSMGSGPAVLVIPGALSVAADYVAFASTLAEHFTVHIIERRGRGLSDPQGDDYSIIKECEDVHALQQSSRTLKRRNFPNLTTLGLIRGHHKQLPGLSVTTS